MPGKQERITLIRTRDQSRFSKSFSRPHILSDVSVFALVSLRSCTSVFVFLLLFCVWLFVWFNVNCTNMPKVNKISCKNNATCLSVYVYVCRSSYVQVCLSFPFYLCVCLFWSLCARLSILISALFCVSMYFPQCFYIYLCLYLLFSVCLLYMYFLVSFSVSVCLS